MLELRQGPLRDALAAAREPLSELGRALRSGTPVVLVPGNHDHRLLRPWSERRAAAGTPPAPLGLHAAVDWRPGEPLDELASWLAPGELAVCYPGCWVRDDVYATHGHYLDRHTTVPTLERLGAGAMARIVGEGRVAVGGPGCAEDYEATLGALYAWLDALAESGPGRPAGESGPSVTAWRALVGPGRRGLRRRAAGRALPALVAVLNRAGLGPVSADVSVDGLRRGALRAAGEVLLRLRVPARHVIFGHTHRAGPLPGDAPAEWRTATGTRLYNCGGWVHEPAFVGPDPGHSPYRPGFCVVVDGADPGRPPELLNLLDRPGPA